ITFHLRPMNCTLYWFMLLMLYLNLLFVDNSVAEEAYYTDLNLTALAVEGQFKLMDTANQQIFPLGFAFKVHQKTFKSLMTFKSEATVFMGDAFENGKPVRSFRIVDGNYSQSNLESYTYGNAFVVFWGKLNYCKSYPGTYANIIMYIYNDGTIQYYISYVYGETENCPMTIEITDGNYNGSTNGNGIIDVGKIIHTKVYPSTRIATNNVFTLVPQLRCSAQASVETCTAESQLNANCSWCPECKTCLLENNTQSSLWNTSICDCSEKVETTVSEVNGLNDNGSSTDYESSKATTQRHDRANGMSTVVHGITDSIMNTNDNNDSTIDSETSKGTTQRQDVEKRKSINDYKPRVTYTKLIYYILGIVLGLFVIFAVCLILWKYLYKQY
ncbi:hypothetical protein MN116_000020, partial [Schistosoma mekongi]